MLEGDLASGTDALQSGCAGSLFNGSRSHPSSSSSKIAAYIDDDDDEDEDQRKVNEGLSCITISPHAGAGNGSATTPRSLRPRKLFPADRGRRRGRGGGEKLVSSPAALPSSALTQRAARQ
jgi:hypothetical protein